MRKLLVIGVATVVLLGSGVGTALAGGYVSGSLAAVMLDDANFELGMDRGELAYTPGLGVIGAIGSTLGAEVVRGELELALRVNGIDQVRAPGYPPFDVGDMTSISLMANLFLDFAPSSSISPFLGGGVGFSTLDLTIEGMGNGNDTVMAYQLAAGAAFALTDKASIDVQYRYFATEDPDLDGLKTEYATQNLLFGVRLMF